jgi:DNA-binding NarL/FixJ family response regulator
VNETNYNSSYKVLIADDHTLIIDSLVTIISEFDMVSDVFTATSRDQVFKVLGKEFVDILVLDINIGGNNMLDYLEKIRKYSPEIKIVVLTGYSDQSILTEALNKNVDAYLTKNTDPKEIHYAFTQVVNGRNYIKSAAITNKDMEEAFLKSQNLTSREREILRLIARGYTNSRVAKELHISIHTIRSHRKNLHRKLNISNVNELIAFAYNNNLVDPKD